MAVNHPFIASRNTFLRLVFCIVLSSTVSITGLFAQDDSSQADEKHIYDSSERFFNRKAHGDDPYYGSVLDTNRNAERGLEDLKKDKAFWYVGAIEKIQGRKVVYRRLFDSLNRLKQGPPDEQLLDEEDAARSPMVNTLLWILIIGILVFALVYFLAANKINFFSRRDIVSQANNDGNAPGVNIFESRLDEMFSKAAAEKNFRLMTRILYLQTLRLLSDRNMIRYNPSYTNLEYLHQMHPSDHYLDFFTITRHYEYVWYGKFELDEPVFRQIENAIRSFHKRIA